jgi:hypothetical protein
MMIIDQEKLVDNIIVNDIVKTYPELKKLIKNCSPYEVRGKILSVLDPRNDLHYDYREFHELNLVCDDLSYLDEITTTLRNYVRVADTEVKTHGEVMTPIWLVEDMLNTLPSEVWTNKDLKWLDPCAGVGTFYSIVVQRLMKGLKKAIPNKNKRYRHIIENMLFTCELQAKNMFIYHCIFDRPNVFELNTFYGSFLSDEFNEHMANVWNVEKFDIVIGNPPYQTQKEGNTKTHPLWHLFVEKSISILTDGGYLNMVHPSGWRNVDGMFKDTQKRMLSNDIIFLEIHNEKDGMNTFGAETRYDFYCLRKSNRNVLTKIIGQSGKEYNIKLKGYEFIPNDSFDKIYSLVANSDDEKVVVISDSSYHTQRPHLCKDKNLEFKYDCFYTIKSGDVPTLWYSNTNQFGHYGIPKLVWSNFRISSAGSKIDMNGDYGLTQFSYGIVDEPNNLPNIKKAFDSKQFRDLMEDCAVSDMSINRKVIATFRKDFYKQFLND